MKKSYLKNAFEKGFSFVEILLVIMVLGLIVTLIANLPNSITLIGSSKRYSLAKDIATKELENIRLKGYDNLGSIGTSTFSDSRLSSLASGSATLTIADCPVSICKNDETDIKQVTVTLTWREKNQTRTINLATLIAEGGLK